MKKLLIITAVLAVVLTAISSCKKNNSGNNPAPSENPTPIVSDTTQSQSDTVGSTDITPSDMITSDLQPQDAEDSEEVSEQEQLSGTWQAARKKHIYTFSFDYKNGKCVYSRDNKSTLLDYTHENGVIALSDGTAYSVELAEKQLKLEELDGKSTFDLKRIKKQQNLTDDMLVGNWVCSVFATEDGSEAKIEFTLNSNGECDVMASDSSAEKSALARWELKRNRLIINNGNALPSGQLEYKILSCQDDLLTLDFYGLSLCFAKS